MHLTTTSRHHPLRLSRPRRLALYCVGLGVWLSGALWLIFHYFLVRKTAFGPSPHPLEHWWLSLHGLFAFAALAMFGFLWGMHIVGGWESRRRRLSGSLLSVTSAILVATGYLLYYPPTDGSLPAIALLHWIVGLMAVIPFLVHRFWRGTARKRQHLSKGHNDH